MGTRKPTGFALSAPYEKRVTVAGSFNNWDPFSRPVLKDQKGIWHIEIYLGAGQYEYKFVVDEERTIDPECTVFVATPKGTVNCVKVVE